MRIILFILINLCLLNVHGQFTYFNEMYGEFGDQETELSTNVEIVGDSIYMFGGIDDDQNPFKFLLRILDLEGNIINERSIHIDASESFLGYGWSLSSNNSNRFIYSQGATVGEVQGLTIMFNTDLDTVWSKTFNNYSPFTYFRANWDVGDGILVSGMHDVGNQAGTFLMKLDYFGEIVWNKVIRNAEGLIYYNHDLISLDSGYLLGGSRTMGEWNAMLTKTDLEGNVEWEYYADNFVDDDGEPADSQEYRLTKLPNGEIVGGHMVWYEFAGGNPSPNNPNWWTSLHLSKINAEDTSLYWEHAYLTDHEMRVGMLWKILPTEDNGILAMGLDQGEVNYAWLLKVDSMGNQEWFNYYSHSEEIEDRNNPYDIEQTSDGGYVMVGEYYNFLNDNYAQSWVIKIDACGDVEWQGCDYVGIQESKKRKVKVYPNPARDFISIELEDLSNKTQVLIYNQLGQVVLNERLVGNNQLYIGQLRSGLYQLVLREDGAVTYSSKIVIEK